MKNIFDHIEHVRGKPHHIRKKIAFSAAAFGSALVALVWFAGSLATGAFAIHGSNFAESSGQAPSVVPKSNAISDEGFAGAAAAVRDTNVPAYIEVVDTAPPAPAKSQYEQTILPF
ncbi:MAG: hypothetical protein WAW90_01580 [Minisyncoccia bacterium]